MNRTELIKVPQIFTDFMAMPESIYKNIIYFKDISNHSFPESNIFLKDDKIHYSFRNVAVKKKGNKYYTKQTNKQGFTLDNGKLSIWFGKSIETITGIEDVFEHFGYNWLDNRLMPYITKSIAEKIFKGKITNNKDIIKAYIKVMRLDVSPQVMLDMVLTSYITKVNFLSYASVAKDLNHLITFLLDKERDNPYIIQDLAQQAKILGYQIDFKWSDSRINEEHKKWTKEIMYIQKDYISKDPIVGIDKYIHTSTNEFELLDTEYKIFEEGTLMNHCLYTNYLNPIREGRYLAYHGIVSGIECTLGVSKYEDTYQYNQCYGKGNTHLDPNIISKAHKIVEKLNQLQINN